MDDNEKDRLSNLYLDTVFALAEKILQLQAHDITENDLFIYLKETMRPDLYGVMYHKIVAKDYLGSVFSDLDAESDFSNLNDIDEMVLKEN